MTRYRKFYVLIQEFFLKVDIDFLVNIHRVFTSDIHSGDRFGDSEIYRQFEEDLEFIKEPLEYKVEDMRITRISFFESLHLSPLKFYFQFSLESDDEELAR